jgi:uncharacterized membrane protein
MVSSARAHFRKHVRFYSSAMLGLAAAVAVAKPFPQLEIVVGADTFFATYLLLITALVVSATPERLRQLSGVEDAGIVLIVVIALGAVVVSLGSIFMLLYQQPGASTVQFVLALASAPLGWLMLHTIAALHYAHRYYTRTASDAGRQDSGGLKFPGTHDPHAWDFIYFSFVIGMTAQVSDVAALTTRMRQVILVHAVISFVFNTILIALAVNVAVALR